MVADVVDPKWENRLMTPSTNPRREFLRSKIRTIPNFPKPGIQFRDITTLVRDGEGFAAAVEELAVAARGWEPIDVVVGIESRGFILGGALAVKLGKGLVLVRKPNKLPRSGVTDPSGKPVKVLAVEYALEYGTDKLEIHTDAVKPGARCLIVDDLIATGGSALAAAQLVERVGGVVAGCLFLIDLPEIGGAAKLRNAGLNCVCLLEFAGE